MSDTALKAGEGVTVNLRVPSELYGERCESRVEKSVNELYKEKTELPSKRRRLRIIKRILRIIKTSLRSTLQVNRNKKSRK
jgi:hypothetical protein